MREETEWVETVQSGWNRLTGARVEAITTAVDDYLNSKPSRSDSQPYGDGNASEKILTHILAKQR